MAAFSVDVTNLDDFLGRIEKSVELFKQSITLEFAEGVIEEAKRRLVEGGHVVTGNLLNSGFVEVQSDGNVVFGFDAEYAKFVDLGTVHMYATMFFTQPLNEAIINMQDFMAGQLVDMVGKQS